MDLSGTFAGADEASGAAAINAVFQHYVVPMSFSPEQFALHVRANSIALHLSPLWHDEAGRICAAALLGVRGDRGWVGGFGVAPEYRGRGYGTRLLEHLVGVARAAGLESLTLEVLEGNTAARALYEAAGFRDLRRLHSLAAETGGDAPPGFRYADPQDLDRERSGTRPCWQCEAPETTSAAALVLDRSTYALFRGNGESVQIYAFSARSAEKAAALTRALAEGRSNRRLLILNEPEGSRTFHLAAAAGWKTAFTQHEMRLEV